MLTTAQRLAAYRRQDGGRHFVTTRQYRNVYRRARRRGEPVPVTDVEVIVDGATRRLGAPGRHRKDSGRGLSGDCTIVDEAFAYSHTQAKAGR